MRSIARELAAKGGKQRERDAAGVLAENLLGIGPKQSRNMLQWLGLTRYEIPLDSRVIRWLNTADFPFKLSSAGLSDPAYYEFVLDGVQHLCASVGIFPCELDAMIFAEGEPEDWDGGE